MAKFPEFSLIGFRLSFLGFYRTVPVYHIRGQFMTTLPSGYFAVSDNSLNAMKFVDFYWKVRAN